MFKSQNLRVWLTAFLDGFVAPVGTVSGFVAHFAHLDALPAATLELLGAVTLSHCGENFTSMPSFKEKKKELKS